MELPPWYEEYEKHRDYWFHDRITDDTKYMKLSFIPAHNQYKVLDFIKLKAFIQSVIPPTWVVRILDRCESGFQFQPDHEELRHDNGIPQIRMNFGTFINPEDIGDVDRDIIPMEYFSGQGLLVFTMTAYKGIPRKLMLKIHNYLISIHSVVTETYGSPNHKDDIGWDRSYRIEALVPFYSYNKN